MNTEPYVGVSPGTIIWAAEQVIRMHDEPGTDDRCIGHCEQCRGDGRCDLLAWARRVIGPAGGRDE